METPSSEKPMSHTIITMPQKIDPKPQIKPERATGYDKYINWKIFIIPIVLFFAILFMPTSGTMKDVGTEYQVGPTAVKAFIVDSLFHKPLKDADQWQLLIANIMEQNMRMGALYQGSVPHA